MRELEEAATVAPLTNATSKCYLHCTLTNTHKHAHTHTVAKGAERPPRHFFEVSVLEPTLDLLLVFSIARHGMEGPALRGLSKTLFYPWEKACGQIERKK